MADRDRRYRRDGVGLRIVMEGAALDNAILMLGVAAQLVVIAVFLPWWRCMRPASFVARREAVATNDVSFAKSFALLLVIGVSARFRGWHSGDRRIAVP